MRIKRLEDLKDLDLHGREMQWRYLPRTLVGDIEALSREFDIPYHRVLGTRLMEEPSPESDGTMYDDACKEMVDFLQYGIVSSPDALETPLTDDEIVDLIRILTSPDAPEVLRIDTTRREPTLENLRFICDFALQIHMKGII